MDILGSTEVEFKETGRTSADIPNNNKARLMYYLECVCNVLNLDDDADINSLRKYTDYQLTEDETDRLITLCYLLR